MEGAGPGSRPSEASGSSTLLRSGTRHARVMQGVAWGCTGSFQRAGGSPSRGALTRSRRHPAERPRVGSGPSPAVTGGDSAGPPKVRQSEGPAVTSAREYRTRFEEIRQRHGLVTNTKEDALPPSPTGGWLPGSRTAGVEGVGTADAGGDIGGRGAGPERGPTLQALHSSSVDQLRGEGHRESHGRLMLLAGLSPGPPASIHSADAECSARGWGGRSSFSPSSGRGRSPWGRPDRPAPSVPSGGHTSMLSPPAAGSCPQPAATRHSLCPLRRAGVFTAQGPCPVRRPPPGCAGASSAGVASQAPRAGSAAGHTPRWRSGRLGVH